MTLFLYILIARSKKKKRARILGRYNETVIESCELKQTNRIANRNDKGS